LLASLGTIATIFWITLTNTQISQILLIQFSPLIAGIGLGFLFAAIAFKLLFYIRKREVNETKIDPYECG
jgi:hypothetical protein